MRTQHGAPPMCTPVAPAPRAPRGRTRSSAAARGARPPRRRRSLRPRRRRWLRRQRVRRRRGARARRTRAALPHRAPPRRRAPSRARSAARRRAPSPPPRPRAAPRRPSARTAPAFEYALLECWTPLRGDAYRTCSAAPLRATAAGDAAACGRGARRSLFGQRAPRRRGAARTRKFTSTCA